MRFDLVDLRLFDAIVQSGSISKGAEAAHMALASASARVSGMEAALGVPLLDRGRRGVTPTAAGRTLLPAALGVFLAAHPGVDVDIEERTSAEIVLAVAEGQVEFGVIAASADPGPLEIRPLGIDRLTVIVSRGNPLSARQEISFAELLDEPFVGLSAGALHDHLTLNAARIGRRINYRVRLRSFEAIAKLVEAGIGVGILPLAAVERHLNPGLTVIRLTDAWADRYLVICSRSFAALTAHARSFVDEIERQGRAQIAALTNFTSTPETAGPPNCVTRLVLG
jgi:DNA-binding transcriptional LysR family regulator